MSYIFEGQSGRINFNIGIDASLASTVVLNWRNPAGEEGEFTNIGTFVAETGDMYYDALAADFNEVGNWTLWSYVVTGTEGFPGNPFILEVKPEGSAIVNKDLVKQVLNINSDIYDTQIDNLIPLIEADYLRIRFAPFEKDVEGNIVYPSGSSYTCSLMIGHKLVPVAEFDPEEFHDGDVSGESIGSYSVSLDSGSKASQELLSGGYPLSITGSIKRMAVGY